MLSRGFPSTRAWHFRTWRRSYSSPRYLLYGLFFSIFFVVVVLTFWGKSSLFTTHHLSKPVSLTLGMKPVDCSHESPLAVMICTFHPIHLANYPILCFAPFFSLFLPTCVFFGSPLFSLPLTRYTLFLMPDEFPLSVIASHIFSTPSPFNSLGAFFLASVTVCGCVLRVVGSIGYRTYRWSSISGMYLLHQCMYMHSTF